VLELASGETAGRPVYEVKALLFKALGHPVRIQVLHVLREGPSPVADIAARVGVSGSTLSQHLAVLRRAGIVQASRTGSSLIYEVVDARVFSLLETARLMLTSRMRGTTEMLADLEGLAFGIDEPGARPGRDRGPA
jgi:ArsR family transcriptional regulator, arsenate/arsenite/antimonite-responsive transcriptional repressor